MNLIKQLALRVARNESISPSGARMIDYVGQSMCVEYLRRCLSELEKRQEPVAWMYEHEGLNLHKVSLLRWKVEERKAPWIETPLYIASSIPESTVVPDGWQPIETAPRDGTEILIKDGVGGVHGAKWTTYHGKTDWFHHTNLGWLPSASSWMPLP